MGTNVKIFISCHKPSEYVSNEVLQPIQVGTVLKNFRLTGILHDDEGDNISELNPRFCELTAQYYAWKNQEADYYGFFHYRRYFSFNKKIENKYDIWLNVNENYITPETETKLGLSSDNITRVVSKYDIILPELKDITKMPQQGKNIKEQYLGSGYLHESDLRIMMDVLKEKYPKFVPYAEKYFAGKTTYLNNMFIMRKDIFNIYSRWLFDILFECNKRIDFSDYSVEAIRTPGHLAERLLNIFVLYIREHKHCKIKELPTVAFLNTDPVPDYLPAFQEHNVAVALSANDYYAPYVATLLTSIREHSSIHNNYDIIIMNMDISLVNKSKLCRIFQDCPNFSLRFIDVGRYKEKFKHIFLRGHFKLETYFRLLMQDILPSYHKILYLDSDMVVVDDLAELYDTDVTGYLLAACHDADTAGLYNGYEPQKKQYMDNVLKIKHPYEYFQAGVILFNLDEFRKQYTVDDMLKFATSYKWELLDQDVLNFLAQEHYKAVDMSWNVMTDWRGIRKSDIISRAPKYLSDEYAAAHNSPKIIHYAGPDKPWEITGSDYAEVFWKYARMTEYYEIIIQRLMYRDVYALRRDMTVPGRIKNVRLNLINTVFPPDTKRRENLDELYVKMKLNNK